ncbi:MAG: hypothetical protein EXR72_19425 [Myxococcales bacterium]|nr:hypothetical protein [Myxococcales bacterium]
MRATPFDRRQVSDARAEGLLVAALRGRQTRASGALTRADAVALTGLPVEKTDQALKSLLRTYRSHLAVTDEGELIYTFDPAMARRDAVPFGERLALAGRALSRAFAFLFKIWIVVTLISYVVAFAAMMIALLFARSASDRDDRRRDDGFGFSWLLWWMMPDWAPAHVQRRVDRGPQKRFYLSVFDFVFGPRLAAEDQREPDRAVVAYLRARGGRITATDLVALTGLSYERAEEEATRLLADYDGEPEVTDEGTIVYSFPELRRTAGEVVSGTWRYAWQEPRPLPPFTGNTTGANAAIWIMNGFNLLSAFVIGPAFLLRYGIQSSAADLAVTWFPLAFSSLFFAIPAVRFSRHRRLARRLEAARARSAVLAEVIETQGAAALPEDLVRRAALRGEVAPDAARRELEALLRDLDGDANADPGGRLCYAFPRVKEELAAVDKARTLAPISEQGPGTIVFSSDDRLPTSPPSILN